MPFGIMATLSNMSLVLSRLYIRGCMKRLFVDCRGNEGWNSNPRLHACAKDLRRIFYTTSNLGRESLEKA